jgi:hypothetical protein
MVEGRPEQHLASEIGLRRHRIPALRRRQRRQQARPVLQPHGRVAELDAVAAIRIRGGFRPMPSKRPFPRVPQLVFRQNGPQLDVGALLL